MTVSSCKHQGNWMHIDRFCVDCVEEVEEKLELAIGELQWIANGDWVEDDPLVVRERARAVVRAIL